jgi:hypothetical protein
VVLPVNERRLTRLSLAIASPTSAPPQTKEQMAPGRPFSSKTLVITFEIAIEQRLVVGAPFLD